MAVKKKAKKKAKTSRKKLNSRKKPATKRKVSKSPAKKKPPKKKAASAKKSNARRSASSTSRATKRVRATNQADDTLRPGFTRVSAPSGRLAGDLQGLSDVEGADSESVDELLDEGNAFEADAVRGVEDADNADEREVHTHEVPEDDVPEEYLDKD